MFYAQRRGIIFPCRLCCLWSCSLSCCRGNGFCGANSACVIFDKWDAEGKNTCTAPSSLPWAALQHRGEKDGLPVFTVHLIAAAHKQTKKTMHVYNFEEIDLKCMLFPLGAVTGTAMLGFALQCFSAAQQSLIFPSPNLLFTSYWVVLLLPVWKVSPILVSL